MPSPCFSIPRRAMSARALPLALARPAIWATWFSATKAAQSRAASPWDTTCATALPAETASLDGCKRLNPVSCGKVTEHETKTEGVHDASFYLYPGPAVHRRRAGRGAFGPCRGWRGADQPKHGHEWPPRMYAHRISHCHLQASELPP